MVLHTDLVNFEVLLTIRLIVPAVMLLVGGIAADHLDRRVLMIIADGLRCLVRVGWRYDGAPLTVICRLCSRTC